MAYRSALNALLGGSLVLIVGQVSGDGMQPKVAVDDSSFKCITEMTSVRHFYVDNLLGNLSETVAVAEAGKGD